MKPGQFNDKVVVIGHRGCGKNKTLSQGEIPEARPSIRENTICSFNTASKYGADFVEFDVQVTSNLTPFSVSSAFRVLLKSAFCVNS
jgi:glycerophosphodiester phosphodiesterase